MSWPIGKKHSEKTKKLISVTLKGRIFSPEHIEKIRSAAIGKKYSSETIEKIRSAAIGRKHTLESRKKISAGVCKAIQEGRINPAPRYISGDFLSKKNNRIIHYRSSLELHWYQLLEQMDKVKKYHEEPVIIAYEFEGSIHHYIPDLRIRYTDGTTELVEIKPEYLQKHPQNLAKWKAARKWCEGRRIPTTFKVVGYKELKGIGK